MGEHQIRIRRGDLEFEARGDRDFVEGALERWAQVVFAYPAVRDAERAAADRLAGAYADSADLPKRMRVRKNISFEDFLQLKGPSNSLDRLLTLAYFLEKYEGRARYELSELDEEWHLAFPEAALTPDIWRDAVARGYLEDQEGQLTLTFSGEAYVRNGLADRFRR